jgi:tripartite-type tricarboxylate transporter receptor subunit TctC
MNRRELLVGLAISAVAGGGVRAESYPDRLIRIIVPYPPGQASDVITRMLADRISQSIGKPIVIENRSGAGGNIGTEAGARAANDGYTITIATAALPITKLTYRKLNFDPIGDFEPVSMMTITPLLLAVSRKLGVSTVAELVAYAKKNPGKVSFASSGVGTSHHLSGELFAAMAGLQLVHIPYRGSGPAQIDLMSGVVDIMFDNIVAIGPQVRQGNLTGLAVTTHKRAPSFPDLPTMAEAGFKEFEATAWFGALVPKKTPAVVVQRLNEEFVKALSAPDIVQKLGEMGAQAAPSSAADFGRFMQAEVSKWKPVVERAQISLD